MPSNTMFACLEVDTEDAAIWAKIDATLAKELGLTHVAWGVDKGAPELKPFRIPNCVFAISTELSASTFADMVHNILVVANYCPYVLLIVGGGHWSIRYGVRPQPVPTNLSQAGTEDMVNREA